MGLLGEIQEDKWEDLEVGEEGLKMGNGVKIKAIRSGRLTQQSKWWRKNTLKKIGGASAIF